MFRLIPLFAVVCGVAVGCATQSSPDVYHTREALQAGTAETVTVVHVRRVTIAGSDNVLSSHGLPGILGGLAGAVLRAHIGSGTGSYVAAAVSGVAAGVRKDDGRQIAVTQDADQAFVPGARLYLVSSVGGYRLTR